MTVFIGKYQSLKIKNSGIRLEIDNKYIFQRNMILLCIPGQPCGFQLRISASPAFEGTRTKLDRSIIVLLIG